MIKKLQELLLNIGIFALSSGVSKLLVFVCLPIYTLYFSSEQYAMLDLSQTTMLLILPITTVSISDAVIRLAMSEKENRSEIFSIGIRVVAVANLIVALFIPLCCYLFDSTVLAIAFFFYFSFNSVATLFSSYCRAIDLVKLIAFASIISAVVSFSMVILTIVFLGLGLLGFFLSSICGLFASSLFYGIVMRKDIVKAIKCKPEKALAKKMVLFSLPLVPNAIFWSLSMNSGKYVLTAVSGLATVGMYSAASKIPSILSTIVSIFQKAWNLSVYKEHDTEESSDKFVYGVFIGFRFLNLVVSILLIAFSPQIAGILLQGDFVSAWNLIPLLICASYYSSMNAYYGSFFSAAFQTKALFVTTVIGAFVNVALCAILSYSLGAFGAVISLLLANVSIYVARKRSIIKLELLSRFLFLQEGAGVALLLFAVLRTFIESGAVVLIASICMLGFAGVLLYRDKTQFRAA